MKNKYEYKIGDRVIYYSQYEGCSKAGAIVDKYMDTLYVEYEHSIPLRDKVKITNEGLFA